MSKFETVLNRLVAEVERRALAENGAEYFEKQHLQSHAALMRADQRVAELSEQLAFARGAAVVPK